LSNPHEGPADTRLSITLTRADLPAYEAALEQYAAALWVEFDATDDSINGHPSDTCCLHIYSASGAAITTITEALQRLNRKRGDPSPPTVTSVVPTEDWAALSQQTFDALRVGRYVIRGAHVPPPPAGSIDLMIEAGAAFGSGSHQTTQGCLLAIQKLAKRKPMRRVLDMGTGSGILAVAAAKTWGPATVLGTDNDTVAVLSAAQSVRRNGVAGRIRILLSDGYAAPAIRQAAPYDLIIANILARPLRDMASALARHLAPGGHAILSGILHQDRKSVV